MTKLQHKVSDLLFSGHWSIMSEKRTDDGILMITAYKKNYDIMVRVSKGCSIIGVITKAGKSRKNRTIVLSLDELASQLASLSAR